jgi:hypothetical protein
MKLDYSDIVKSFEILKSRVIQNSLKKVEAYTLVILKAISVIFALFERANSDLYKVILIKILQCVNPGKKRCPTILSLRDVKPEAEAW